MSCPGRGAGTAIRTYNAYQLQGAIWRDEDDNWQPASTDSDPAFLARIQVNYLRHHQTQYDRALEALAGQVGVRAAVRIVRARVYAAIAAVYPQFATECERQRLEQEAAGDE